VKDPIRNLLHSQKFPEKGEETGTQTPPVPGKRRKEKKSPEKEIGPRSPKLERPAREGRERDLRKKRKGRTF